MSMSSNTGSEELYKCQVCCKTFSRRTYLVLHEKIHGEKSYKCDICAKAFSQPAGLWIHKKHQSCLKRNSPGESHAISESGQRGDDKVNGGKRHECGICERRFSQKHLLSYHMRTHTGENPYPCTTCGKTFRGPVTLKYHERTHTGQRPHTCIFCAKSFTQLGPLKAHCRKEHQSDRIYECDVCLERFEKFRELSSHKKKHLEASTSSAREDVGSSDTECVNASVHDSRENLNKSKKMEKESDLETNVSSFSDNSSVKTSISSNRDISGGLINTKKRKKKIESISLDPRRKVRLKKSVAEAVTQSYSKKESSCGLVKENLSKIVPEELKTINYGDLSLPESHVPAKRQNEAASVRERIHKCNVCGEEFSEENALQSHSKSHTEKIPPRCTDCNKTFRTSGALTVHQRTHNGKRPYKCIFCPQDFTQRGALLQHCRRIHNTNQIYECNVCDEKFEKHRDLLSHSHALSDAPCTMAKRTYMYDDVDFAVKLGDYEAKQGEDATDSPLSSSDTNGANFDSIRVSPQQYTSCIVTNDDNKKHWGGATSIIREEDESSGQDGHENRSNCVYEKKVENIERPLSHECFSSVSIKKEKEDCDSYDSGISPDPSPLNVNVKCDEPPKDLMYEISMQPIKPGCEETNYVQAIGSRPSRTTNSMEIHNRIESTQQDRNIRGSVVSDDCFKTGDGVDDSDDDVSSNCSRVTTPDNVSLFSESPGHNQQNSLSLDEMSDTYLQLCDKSNIFAAQPLDPRQRSLTEDDIRSTYCWQRNDCLSSIGFYGGRNLRNNSTEIGPTSELPGSSNVRAFHSDGSVWR